VSAASLVPTARQLKDLSIPALRCHNVKAHGSDVRAGGVDLTLVDVVVNWEVFTINPEYRPTLPQVN